MDLRASGETAAIFRFRPDAPCPPGIGGNVSTGGPAGGSGIRYEPDERPPATLALGLGLQLAILNVAIPILIPTVVMRAAGATEGQFVWAVFVSVAVCGAATALQAVRFGRFGSGHVLVMAGSSAFIGISITAIVEGGPALLATLVVIAALFQLLISARLALFRGILTPTVSGTVIMLVPVTVMPVVFGMLEDTPDGSPALAAPASALATMLVIFAIALKATGAMRLWAPVTGVVAGSAVGWFFGIYDVDRVAAASWIGFPEGEWPGVRSRLRTGLLGAPSRVSAGGRHRRHPGHEQLRGNPAGVLAPGPGRRLPGGPGHAHGGGSEQPPLWRCGERPEYHPLDELVVGRADRRRGPARRGGDRGNLHPPCILSEGTGRGPRDSGPCRHRLPRRPHGSALRGRREHRHAERNGLSQGADRRCLLLGGGRVPERPGVSRTCCGARGRPVSQRDDDRRPDGHIHDHARGVDEAAPEPDRDRARSPRRCRS